MAGITKKELVLWALVFLPFITVLLGQYEAAVVLFFVTTVALFVLGNRRK